MKLKSFDYDYFKEELKDSDLLSLEYLKDYITEDLKDLFYEVMNYNEIYANGWTIEDLFEMGKKDSYWTSRAKNFIKKYNVKKKDYRNYTKFFEEYCEKRDLLFKKIGFDLNDLYN